MKLINFVFLFSAILKPFVFIMESSLKHLITSYLLLEEDRHKSCASLRVSYDLVSVHCADQLRCAARSEYTTLQATIFSIIISTRDAGWVRGKVVICVRRDVCFDDHRNDGRPRRVDDLSFFFLTRQVLRATWSLSDTRASFVKWIFYLTDCQCLQHTIFYFYNQWFFSWLYSHLSLLPNFLNNLSINR